MNNWAMFLAGLTDSYNPCSIGVLLISLTILLGLKQRKLIILFGLSYLSAIFVTYFLIGLGFLKAFHLFGVHGFFGYAAGIILIIVGLVHLFPQFVNKIPLLNWINRCHIPINTTEQLEKGVLLAGLTMGFLIGLCTVPCAGGIYLGAIGLLATKTSYWQGVWRIFIFNLGFILPLLTIFIISSRQKFLKILERINIKISSFSTYAISLIMILMGIGLLIISAM